MPKKHSKNTVLTIKIKVHKMITLRWGCVIWRVFKIITTREKNSSQQKTWLSLRNCWFFNICRRIVRPKLWKSFAKTSTLTRRKKATIPCQLARFSRISGKISKSAKWTRTLKTLRILQMNLKKRKRIWRKIRSKSRKSTGTKPSVTPAKKPDTCPGNVRKNSRRKKRWKAAASSRKIRTMCASSAANPAIFPGNVRKNRLPEIRIVSATIATNPDIFPGNVRTSFPTCHAIIAAKPDTFPGSVRIRRPAWNATTVANPDICPGNAGKKMAPIRKCSATTAKIPDIWQEIVINRLNPERIADHPAEDFPETGEATTQNLLPELTICPWDPRNEPWLFYTVL